MHARPITGTVTGRPQNPDRGSPEYATPLDRASGELITQLANEMTYIHPDHSWKQYRCHMRNRNRKRVWRSTCSRHEETHYSHWRVENDGAAIRVFDEILPYYCVDRQAVSLLGSEDEFRVKASKQFEYADWTCTEGRTR